MPTWLDNFPGSPLVQYQNEDGSTVFVPRAKAQQFGFTAEPVPPELDVETAQSPFAPAPSAPTPPAPQPPQQIAAPPAPAPVEELPAPGGVTAPGIGLVPTPEQPLQPGEVSPQVSRSLGIEPAQEQAPAPADIAPPQPTGPQSQQDVDQALADETASTIAQSNVERKNAAYLAERQREAQAEERARQWNDYQSALKKSSDHKIDPNRKWASLGTGKKIGAVVMALVSGIGSALKKQGDRNPALELIMQSIQDDVALQMAERDELGRQVERKRTALDEVAKMHQSRDAERSGRIAAIAQREANVLREAAAKAQSESVKFEYENLAAQMEAAAAQAAEDGFWKEQEFMLKAGETAAKIRDLNAKAALAERKAAGGGGGALAGKTGTAGQYASLDQIDPKYRDNAVRLPDGSWVITNSSDSAKNATEMMGGSRVMVQNIDRALEKLAGSPGMAAKLAGKVGLEGEDIAVIKQEVSQLLMNGKNYYTLGALSESDINIVNSLGADPSAATAFVQQVWPKLQNWRNGITQDALAKLQTFGVDINEERAFGAAPQKAQRKSPDQFGDEITAGPTYDRGRIVAMPQLTDAKANLEGMREAFALANKSDEEWNGRLRTMAAHTRTNAANVKRDLDKVNDALAKAEKGTGDKADAKVGDLKARKIELAAALANYKGIEREIERQRARSIEKERSKATEQKRTEEKKKRVEERGTVGRML